jgi:hypothetical protein
VPLCRCHRRQLHQAGSELTWCQGIKIEPLAIGKALWEQTHPKTVETVEARPSNAAEDPANFTSDGQSSEQAPEAPAER